MLFNDGSWNSYAVQQVDNGANQNYFRMGRNGYCDVCILESNGNVGINTSAPAYNLGINETTRVYYAMVSGDSYLSGFMNLTTPNNNLYSTRKGAYTAELNKAL